MSAQRHMAAVSICALALLLPVGGAAQEETHIFTIEGATAPDGALPHDFWKPGPPSGRYEPVWLMETGRVTIGSPRFVDVNGDGHKDVVIATMGPLGNPYSSSAVYVLDITGQLLAGWPVTLNSPITSCVDVADIDGDGRMELVASSWSSIHVWRADGTSYPGWPIAHGSGYSVSAVLADLDHDCQLELICAVGPHLRVYRNTGALMWNFNTSKPVAAPAVADLDGDGALEILAGTWEGPYPGTGPYPFYVWRADGSLVPGFPITPDGQTRGPVSIADLDHNGTLEIVARINDCIYVWDRLGHVQPGWPVCPGDATRNSATAVGDLDLDGDLEVVIAGFHLNAYHHDGSVVAGWPVDVPPGSGNIVAGPVIADLDSTQFATPPEVLIHSYDMYYAVHGDGTVVDGFPIELSDDNNTATFVPTAAVNDADGDGLAEFVLVSTSGRIAYYDASGWWFPSWSPWPEFLHDRTGTCNARILFYPGDLNCDGAVDFGDINPFVLALTGCAPYTANYPNCSWLNADCNNDGLVNFGDINAFVGLLTPA